MSLAFKNGEGGTLCRDRRKASDQRRVLSGLLDAHERTRTGTPNRVVARNLHRLRVSSREDLGSSRHMQSWRHCQTWLPLNREYPWRTNIIHKAHALPRVVHLQWRVYRWER